MKRKIAEITAIMLSLTMLCSCSNSIASNANTSTTTTTGGTTVPQDSAETTTTTTEPTQTTTTTTTEPPIVLPEISEASVWTNNIVITGKGDNMRAIMPYYGAFEYGEQYADVINKFRDTLSEDITIYNMCLPTSAGFYIPDDCKDIFSSQQDNIEHINESLNNSVVAVDAWTALAKHTDEYIYSRTDHHWQPLGAYYATQAFAKDADVDFADLTDYKSHTIDDFLGSMYYFSGYYAPLAENPDTFKYYLPQNKYTTTYYNTDFTDGYEGDLMITTFTGENCYMTFQGGDQKITEVKTDCNNDRTIVIVKDSYGNAISPYLTRSFSKIYVVDFRYFDTDFQDFLEDVGCTDLLFAISVSACQTPTLIDSIEALI